MAAGGAFAFQKGPDGNYNGKETGVNNDGAVAGAQVLKDLIDTGVMPKGVDYGVMDGAFAKGELGMVLNGPWSWAGYKTAGIDVGVAPIPSVNGQPSKPFVGVFAFAVNAASPNKDLAIELLENYILTDESLALWNKTGQLALSRTPPSACRCRPTRKWVRSGRQWARHSATSPAVRKM
jgi:maltose/maltodextrin transport system substrate-binding protein